MLAPSFCDAAFLDVQINLFSYLKATERQHTLHLIYQSFQLAAAGSDDYMYSIPVETIDSNHKVTSKLAWKFDHIVDCGPPS